MITPALKPLTSEPRSYNLIALDSEGTGREGDFVIAVCYDDHGPHIFYDRKKLKGWLFSRANLGKRIVAANLEYDYAVCFQPFSGNYEILLSNRRWMKATYRDNNKHTWTAFDIQRVAPLSVAQMGKIVGLSKYTTPPSLIRDQRYKPDQWQCELHHKTWCIECYCVRDAEITYKFAEHYQRSLNTLGAEMKLTAASTALDLFRREFLQHEIPATWPERNDLARSAYYGGRVEVFKLGTSYDVNTYDVNSLYPFVMRDAEMADPTTYRRVDAVRNPYKYLDHFGQFWGTIKLPEQITGVLPYRSENRLYFPTGQATGSWPLSEIRNALDHGAEIKHCDSILYATGTFKLFQSYVDTLYSQRLKWKADGDPSEIAAKLLMNSLYGKFAQHDDGGLQTLVAPPDGFNIVDYEGDEPVIIADREMFLHEKPSLFQSPHIQVLWAAEITARARCHLYNQMHTLGTSMVYCDTDSIHTFDVLPTSPALGGLKLEHEFPRCTYFAPKEYGGIDKQGEAVHRAKGIPPAYRLEYLKHGAVEFEQPIHTLTAIRRGKRIAEWQTVSKSRRSSAMNRQHDAINNFDRQQVQTYPFDVSEV